MPARADCNRLFVYGTLRRGFALHCHLARLGAAWRAEARVAGELFDLGRYPGARQAHGDGTWVRGELYRLRRPEHDLEELDGVEGFDARAPRSSGFVRALTLAILQGGESRRAWIYWLGPRAPAARRIASGDYAQGRRAAQRLTLCAPVLARAESWRRFQ